jgi:hypothetical protein
MVYIIITEREVRKMRKYELYADLGNGITISYTVKSNKPIEELKNKAVVDFNNATEELVNFKKIKVKPINK